MPPLNSHTHCQVAPARAKSKTLQKVCLAYQTDIKESTFTQHCIKAIAGAVVNRRSVHLMHFFGSGQVITLKSATALILDPRSIK